MVQEANVLRAAASIPDELYNLTQLAEVTLAASKLSTTNLQQIKAYFRTEESEEDDGIVIEDRKNLLEALYVARQRSDSDDSFRVQKYKLKSKYWGQNRNFESSVSCSPNSRSSCPSMSDEETEKDGVIYNYSHKIFDRRKSRKIGEEKGLSDESQAAVESNEELYGLSHLDELNSSAEDIHSCPECGKKYSTSSNLARHRQTHRSLEDKKARRCPHCDKVYVSMPAFSMHVRTHNQGCECPHCGKCFSRPWLLQGHIRTHTGEKPFKCSICNKAFADKSNLRAHIQTHSNTKPHCCLRCGKSFALKSYLYKHEESSCLKNHDKPDRITVKKEKVVGKALPEANPKAKRVSKREKKTPSYVNMANGIESIDHMEFAADFFNPYSRASVIRNSSLDEEDNYQEEPVDFSAKKKRTEEEIL